MTLTEPRELLRLPAMDQTTVVRLLPHGPCVELSGERSAPSVYTLDQLRVLIHALKAAQEALEQLVTP